MWPEKKPEENVRCRAGENHLDVEKKSGNSTLHGFFQLLIESSKRISISIAGEMALKYGNLQSFMVRYRAEILLYKVAKFYRHFYGGGYQLNLPPIQTSVKFRDFAELSSFVLKSLSNLATSLILRRSLQPSLPRRRSRS